MPDGTSMLKVGSSDTKKKDKRKSVCPNCNKDITVEDLKDIFTEATNEKLKIVADTYNSYMQDLDMDTCWNKAHFFAQAMVEGGKSLNLKEGENMNHLVEALPNHFKAFSSTGKRYGPPNELAKKYGRIQKREHGKKIITQKANKKMIANIAYSNRKELGNEGGDDGWNFRGRGLIQITGREIYAYCNTYTLKNDNIDLLTNPDLVGENTSLGVSTSMMFFKWKNINVIANGTTDVKHKICPLVGNNVDIKNSNGVKVTTNYDEKQSDFDEITSIKFETVKCEHKKSTSKK